jgi:hypothetical protein
MFVVHRPLTAYAHPMDEEWQLRCHRCGKRFRTLQECWLCYEVPLAGEHSEARCCHKRCAEGGAQLRLMRSDFALRRLLESLLKPPLAALKDLPSPRRPWGSP